MLPPEIIERIEHEKEERERPSLRLPVYSPSESCDTRPTSSCDDEKEATRVIVIDLL